MKGTRGEHHTQRDKESTTTQTGNGRLTARQDRPQEEIAEAVADSFQDSEKKAFVVGASEFLNLPNNALLCGNAFCTCAVWQNDEGEERKEMHTGDRVLLSRFLSLSLCMRVCLWTHCYSHH